MKIMILGLSCSGKSSFAKFLNRILEIPVYHLDDYYWVEPWKINPNFCINIFLDKDSWILDGNYYNYSFIERLNKSDYIFYIDSHIFPRIYRMIKRHVLYKLEPENKNIISNTINVKFIISTIKKQFVIQPKVIRFIEHEFQSKYIYIRNMKELKKIILGLRDEKSFFELFNTYQKRSKKNT